MKRKIGIVLIFCFAVLFAVSAFQLISYYGAERKQTALFSELRESVEHAEHKIAALQEKNADTWGWLTIADTKLDYPVMHTPEDGEYYLHRDFNKEESAAGVPFLDGNCTDGCGNYIIYGHHMNDGTMFATLLSYKSKEFFAAHPTIQLETVAGKSEYRILAAFYAKAYNEEDTGVFRYYQYTDLTDPDTFAEYVAQAKAAALYDTGVSAEYGDELLTLSTCSSHTKEGRFVLIAKKEK